MAPSSPPLAELVMLHFTRGALVSLPRRNLRVLIIQSSVPSSPQATYTTAGAAGPAGGAAAAAAAAAAMKCAAALLVGGAVCAQAFVPSASPFLSASSRTSTVRANRRTVRMSAASELPTQVRPNACLRYYRVAGTVSIPVAGIGGSPPRKSQR